MKKYAIFTLEDAVVGISNSGLEHDQTSFTLDKHFCDTFETHEEAEQYLMEELKDYNGRHRRDIRFVILPIYILKREKLFK